MAGKPKVDMWRPWPFLTKLQVEQSPSFKLGMSFKAEKKLRSASCKVISEAGKTLDQGMMTVAVAQSYLVRFFAVKPYQQNDNFIIAVAALFVASKTENKPRALADIAHACWRHWVDIWAKEQKRRRKDQPASFWEQKAAAEKSLFRDPEFYKRLAEAALTAERVLLYTTGFQFDVYTGFSAVLAFRKALGEHPDPIVSDLFNETMIQAVWNLVVECYLSTRLCLEYDPRIIGIACFEGCAARVSKEIPLVDGEVWWKSAAKIWKWHDFDTKPHEIKAVRDEIWACFEDPKAAKLSSQEAPAEGSGSQPGTPALTAGSRTPGASPRLMPSQQPVASTSGMPVSAATMNGGGVAHSKSHSGLPHVGKPPLANTPIAPGASASQNLMGRSPTAQVKQKPGALAVHFSPSDEFSASPRGSAPDDSAQTSLPVLLGSLESGELVLEDPEQRPSAAAKDPALMRARLQKARALAGKRKSEDAAPQEGSPKLQRASPELGEVFEP